LTRVITAGLLLILATAPLGDGGRAADLLFVHQSLVALLCICAMHMKRASRLPRTGLLATLALFAVFAMMTSSYRYATMLVLADVVTAAAIVVLASMVSERWRLVVAAIAVGAATNVVAGVGQALAGQPVHGLFANAHHGACLVAAATACLIAARPTGRRALRLMHLGAIVAGGGFVVAIASRGATLALLVGGAVALVTTRRYRLLSVAVAALVAALVLPTPLSRRVRDGVQSDPYAYDRVQIWAAAARLASTNLWRGGVGLGSFADAALAHKFPVERAFGRYQKSPNHAHNEYLQLLAEASLPGLALLLVPVVLAVQRGVRAVHAGGADAPRAAICLGGTAAILVAATLRRARSGGARRRSSGGSQYLARHRLDPVARRSGGPGIRRGRRRARPRASDPPGARSRWLSASGRDARCGCVSPQRASRGLRGDPLARRSGGPVAADRRPPSELLGELSTRGVPRAMAAR